MLKSIMDYKSRAQQANNKYSGVIVTNDIRGNGRKKLLLIGKTGAGKSSVKDIMCKTMIFNEGSMISALQCLHWPSS